MIKEGDADDAQIERARHEKAGALWHIFRPSDTPKIRELMLKVIFFLFEINRTLFQYTGPEMGKPRRRMLGNGR